MTGNEHNSPGLLAFFAEAALRPRVDLGVLGLAAASLLLVFLAGDVAATVVFGRRPLVAFTGIPSTG